MIALSSRAFLSMNSGAKLRSSPQSCGSGTDFPEQESLAYHMISGPVDEVRRSSLTLTRPDAKKHETPQKWLDVRSVERASVNVYDGFVRSRVAS